MKARKYFPCFPWSAVHLENSYSESAFKKIRNGYIHSIPDSFPWRDEELSVIVWIATARNWNKLSCHTLRTLHRSGWPWGFGALNPSPHSLIFTSVSADSSPRSYLFTSATVRIPVYTTPKSCTESRRYVTLHFRHRCGAVSLTEIALR